MKKKEKISREEKVAEEFFPVDEEDIEHAVEVRVKEPLPAEEIRKGAIEKIYKKPDRESLELVEKVSKKKTITKKSSKKKPSKKLKKTKKPAKQVKYTPPKTELKEGGYELVITEKPQAALKISDALGKSTKRNEKGIPYYEVDRDGKKIIVACAVGHLFTLKQNINGSSIPIFDVSWVPNYLVRKKDFSKKYYDVLLKLAKGAGSITVATDYDIEGDRKSVV